MENRFAVPLIHVSCHTTCDTLSICFREFIFQTFFSAVAELCHQFSQCLVERDMPSKGIAPLVKAIQKARMNEMQLTSIHGSLLQLCLMAKNLKPALQFMDVDITEISSEVTIIYSL